MIKDDVGFEMHGLVNWQTNVPCLYNCHFPTLKKSEQGRFNGVKEERIFREGMFFTSHTETALQKILG